MRTMLYRNALILTALLALASPASAQNLVRGVVLDAKNSPVEGATVHFDAQGFVNKRETKTDRRGEFLFQGLTSGEYIITASKDGVGTDQAKFTVDSTSAKQKLSFTLRSTAPAAPAGAAAPAAAPAPLGIPATPAGGGDKAKAEAAAIQAIAQSAIEAQQAGRHEEAVAGLKEVVAKMPTCADCYAYLGTSHYELKQLDEAEAAAKKSIEIQPTVEGYTVLARTYNSQKKFDLAAEASKKAADLAAAAAAPPAAAAGGAPDAAGAKAAASSGAASAAAATGASSETLYNQGVVLWNSGKYAEAKVQFEAAVKANPRNAEAQYQLGMANLNLGQIPAAREAFESYLKVAPNGSKAAEVKTFLTQLPKK
jgi:tetratricopeptide (TPR) repeat protein